MLNQNIECYRNFNHFLEKAVDLFGEKTCLTDGESPSVSYSYSQLNDKVNKTAGLLKKMGVAKGDRFAVFTQNCPEFFFLYLASMKIGSLIIPLDVNALYDEVLYFINKYDVKVLFVDEDRLSAGIRLKKSSPAELNGVFNVSRCADNSLDSFHDALSSLDEYNISFDNIKIDDPGSLYFSSGTTGSPKGVPQSPKNLLTAAFALSKAYNFTSADTQMGILPCCHTALVTYGFWPGFCIGSKFVIFKKFSKSKFWSNISKHGIVFTEVVPTILSMLLNPAEDISKYDLTKLRFIGSGSAPLSIALQQRFEGTFNVLISNNYGLSETAPTHFNPPQRELRKEGSMGKTLPMCEARICDGNNVLPLGKIGEIVIRGDNVIKSYYDNSDLNRRVFYNDWFHTGDLGFRDADGFFWLVGRKKDMIIRGGVNIYPGEIEDVIFSYPSIKEVCCFGVYDEIYGEEVAACVVPEENNEIKEENVIDFCLKHISKDKCPKKIYIVKEMPYTASGKILRRKLSKKYNLEVKNAVKR